MPPSCYSPTRSTRNDTRTCARHSLMLSPRSPTDTTSTPLMLRSVAWASLRAFLTASSELSAELPTSSMIFVTANCSSFRFGASLPGLGQGLHLLDQIWQRLAEVHLNEEGGGLAIP